MKKQRKRKKKKKQEFINYKRPKLIKQILINFNIVIQKDKIFTQKNTKKKCLQENKQKLCDKRK